ncbi:MAG: DNA/RNA nuclease SfsA [Peptococcaceae bacterium]|nr:DNA/RNA nuclease SfsA [Peptococcaceae bacterium]
MFTCWRGNLKVALPEDIVEAVFLERLNRFAALVQVAGRVVKTHVPSSGRMRELLVPGAKVYVAPHFGLAHRTEYRLLLACSGDVLVSVDSLLPNRLLHRAFQAGAVPGFEKYAAVRREVACRRGRIDFLLAGRGGRCLVEVKSVTLVEDGVALFPDAPSLRGARHLEELSASLAEGFRAAAVFVVQRADAYCFSPNDSRDPLFGRALREAHRRGVSVHAFGCRVGLDSVGLGDAIPVLLGPESGTQNQA